MNAWINSVQSSGFGTRAKSFSAIFVGSVILSLVVVSLLPAQALTDSVEVKALNTQASAASLYTLNFTLADTLYPDAGFEISFPPGFDVSKVTIAGSKAINGGFEVKVEGQKVLVQRKGRGATKLPGEKVDVMFSTVTNPANPESNHKINVTIKKSQQATRTKELRGSVLITAEKVQ